MQVDEFLDDPLKSEAGELIQSPPRRRVSPSSDKVVDRQPEAEMQARKRTSRRAEVEGIARARLRADVTQLPEVYGEGDKLRPGTDHGVLLDGKLVATLLASWYPSEFDLQREKRAFREANPGRDIQVRTLRQIS